MDGTSLLIWVMVFASIGVGFFIYGKRQKAVVPLVVGITLFIFPYFITDITMLVIIGAILMILPYFMKF